MNAVLASRVGEPARIHGVHGAAGLTYWTCLARRAGLAGDWEAIEWARVPPGGVSGEHRHTRTEEIYFILSGEAEVRLDGRPHRLGPGGMALTRVGATHALYNVGSTPVDWLVIEMLSPRTAAVVRGRRTDGRAEERNDVTSRVYDLRALGRVDPGEVFDGPLRDIRLRRLAGGDAADLSSDGVEHTLFVTEGRGHAENADTRIELTPGTSVTLPLGAALTVHAHTDGLELFHATLRVDQ